MPASRVMVRTDSDEVDQTVVSGNTVDMVDLEKLSLG